MSPTERPDRPGGRLSADEVESRLANGDGPGDADDLGLVPADGSGAEDAGVDLDAAEALLGELDGTEEAGPGADQDLGSLMDDAFGEGRRLGRLGDCALVVSHDGLTAWLRGALPSDTTYADLVAFLEGAGVCFGVISGRLHEALPTKRRSGRREGRARAAEPDGLEARDLEVARGVPPEPPEDTRIQYTFPVPEAGAFERFAEAMESPSMHTVRRARAELPFVRAGELLAEVKRHEGKAGRDVLGAEVPPPLPPGARLQAGDFVTSSGDGERCTAEICGYVGLRGEVLCLLPPLWVAPDLMTASFVWRPVQPDPPALSAAEIGDVLTALDVSYGLQEEAVAQLAEQLASGDDIEPCTVLAHGLEAEEGARTVWDFCFEPDLTRYYSEIHRILGNARRLDYLQGYAKGLSGKPVNAGERIAEKKPGRDGVMGRDVYGEEFMPPEPKEAHLEAGDFVSFRDEGSVCVAGIYGYLGITDDLVTIVPAIWVDPDLANAYFVNLDHLGESHAPSPAEIDQLLEHAGVKFGVDHKAIGLLCEKLRQDIPCDIAEPIARARPARPGVDGAFDFSVDIEPKPGVFRDDGSVDFRALNLAPLVAAGDPVGVQTLATPGSPGTDLWGRSLSARDGTDVVVDTGKNIGASDGEAGKVAYEAEIDGEFIYQDRRDRNPAQVYLAVHEVMVIQGDVDFSTGSIEFDGSVEVRGSVQSGFSVEAAGNITVGDSVEDGARLEAGANVAVAHGIHGGKTRVTAGASVYAKFIHESRVRSGDDIVVSEYLRMADVHAANDVLLPGHPGNDRSGAILGGLTVATHRIAVQRVGADGSRPTSLVAGVDPALLKRAARLQKIVEQGGAVVSRNLKTLSLDGIDRRELKGTLLALVLRSKGARRKVLAQSVKKLLMLQSQCDRAVSERAAIIRQLEELAGNSRIAVEGTVAVKTAVRIGDRTRVVRDEGADVLGVTFVLMKGKKNKTELRMVAS